MDPCPFEHLSANECDVWMVYDYTDLDVSHDWAEITDAYETVDLVAWSLGVAMAAHACRPIVDRIGEAIAVNGTLRPIDDREGIPAPIFDGTIGNLPKGGLARFRRRMCGSREALAMFESVAPQRSLEDLLKELQALRSHAESLQFSQPLFTRAIIGRDDRIFTAKNQAAHWSTLGVPVQAIDAPHYPFHLWKTWEEVVRAAEGR